MMEKINLKTCTDDELIRWLRLNFTPHRYQTEGFMRNAVYQLYGLCDDAQKIIDALWNTWGQQPDELPNFDSYGRLTTMRPNYAKPGIKEKVAAEVDEAEPCFRVRANGGYWK